MLPSVANAILPILLFISSIAIMLPISIDWTFPVAVNVAVGFSLVVYFSSPVIEVTETSLICKGASIEKEFVGEIAIIPKSEIFDELGRKLDARAWLSIQASVKSLIRVEITDADDPTPYWLITTRKPEELIRAIRGD